MKSQFACAIAVITFTSFSPAAFAEKWVGVGTLQPIGVALTVDADSATRKGDVATILARPVNVSEPKTETFTLDCKRRLMLSNGQSWPVDRDFIELRKTWPRAMLTRIFELACS